MRLSAYSQLLFPASPDLTKADGADAGMADSAATNPSCPTQLLKT